MLVPGGKHIVTVEVKLPTKRRSGRVPSDLQGGECVENHISEVEFLEWQPTFSSTDHKNASHSRKPHIVLPVSLANSISVIDDSELLQGAMSSMPYIDARQFFISRNLIVSLGRSYKRLPRVSWEIRRRHYKNSSTTPRTSCPSQPSLLLHHELEEHAKVQLQKKKNQSIGVLAIKEQNPANQRSRSTDSSKIAMRYPYSTEEVIWARRWIMDQLRSANIFVVKLVTSECILIHFFFFFSIYVRRPEKPRYGLGKKISRKLRKIKTLIFENFHDCQLRNTVERWVLGMFECGFWGLTEKHVKKPTVPLNGSCFKNKISRTLRKQKLSFLKISRNVNIKML